MPKVCAYDSGLISNFSLACKAVIEIRALRQDKGISPKEALELKVKGNFDKAMFPVIEKMANISGIDVVDSFEGGSGQSFMVSTIEFFVPLEGMIDVEAEIAKIEAEILRYQGFLRGVNAKLGNERFVASAPAQVVEMERKKYADATAKIEALQERLKDFK